jgi:hypothetical protein
MAYDGVRRDRKGRRQTPFSRAPETQFTDLTNTHGIFFKDDGQRLISQERAGTILLWQMAGH